MNNVVSESEVSAMQDFFNRISSTIVAHSAQSRELTELRQQVAAINARLDAFSNENDKLRQDLTAAWAAYESVKAERDKARAEAEQFGKDAMAARTETVQVRQEAEQAQAMLQTELDSQRKISSDFEAQLNAALAESRDWQARSNRWEKLAKENESKLATVQAKLVELNNSVRSLFAPEPKEAEPVKEEAPDWYGTDLGYARPVLPFSKDVANG